MSDEAREAAISAERANWSGAPVESRIYVEAHMQGFGVGYAAGVAEGIRQAREAVTGAVAGIEFLDDGTIYALRAIDALEADRG